MQSFLDTARAWCASHPLVVGYALTALVTIALRIAGSAWWESFKASHPRVAALANLARALGFDAPKLLAALRVLLGLPPAPPSGDDKPKSPPTVVVGALSALALLGALGGSVVSCAGAIPAVVTVVSDGLCVLTHFDELAAAERAGASTFVVVAARVAGQCGITVEAVVRAFGAEKASRAARAAKAETAPPACSASVRP